MSTGTCGREATPSSAEAGIDWWAWLDVSEFNGQTARIGAAAPEVIRRLITSSDQIKSLQPLYDEPLRLSPTRAVASASPIPTTGAAPGNTTRATRSSATPAVIPS